MSAFGFLEGSFECHNSKTLAVVVAFTKYGKIFHFLSRTVFLVFSFIYTIFSFCDRELLMFVLLSRAFFMILVESYLGCRVFFY